VATSTFTRSTAPDLTSFFAQTINHYITYSVIAAQPELSYTTVVSTIRCYAVTSGDSEGSTFVEWSGHFSSDADAGTSMLILVSRNV
jgi:hypothetical protein